MSKTEIKLNTEGINQLRKCSEMSSFLTEQAQAIAGRCSGSYEISKPFTGKYHANVEVVTADRKTYYKNLQNNELLKALR